MMPEIAGYDESIRDRLARVVDCLNDLSDAQLNWRPPLASTNSACALAAHTLGNARAWVLGIACGQPMKRDRRAEFAASAADAAAIRDELRVLTGEITAALAGLDPKRLDETIVPNQELWGEDATREVSVRYALVHVIEHASLHLGHLEITRDMILQSGVR